MAVGESTDGLHGLRVDPHVTHDVAPAVPGGVSPAICTARSAPVLAEDASLRSRLCSSRVDVRVTIGVPAPLPLSHAWPPVSTVDERVESIQDGSGHRGTSQDHPTPTGVADRSSNGHERIEVLEFTGAARQRLFYLTAANRCRGRRVTRPCARRDYTSLRFAALD